MKLQKSATGILSIMIGLFGLIFVVVKNPSFVTLSISILLFIVLLIALLLIAKFNEIDKFNKEAKIEIRKFKEKLEIYKNIENLKIRMDSLEKKKK